MKKYIVTHEEIRHLVQKLFMRVAGKLNWDSVKPLRIYPIPRGGVPVAYRLMSFVTCAMIVENPEDADVFIDDIVDSGETMKRYAEQFPGVPFFAMVDQQLDKYCFKQGLWLSFPWEQDTQDTHETIDDNICRLLQYLGEDVNRGGLLETPRRVVKAWEHWCSGYTIDPASVFKVFEDGADGYD